MQETGAVTAAVGFLLASAIWKSMSVAEKEETKVLLRNNPTKRSRTLNKRSPEFVAASSLHPKVICAMAQCQRTRVEEEGVHVSVACRAATNVHRGPEPVVACVAGNRT